MKVKSSKEMFIGGVIDEKASGLKYKTGDWKSFRPIRDVKKCTNCLLCAVYCPENCIKVKKNIVLDADLSYCKGCGICAVECPFKAISMEKLGECEL